MRKALILAAVSAALWCTPAGAAQIVQNVAGNQIVPGSLTLFNTSLGTLDSVQVEGTMNVWEGLIRSDPSSQVSIAHASTGLLALGYGSAFASAALSGDELYAAGSPFGSITLSGTLFTILTGSDVNQFYAGSLLSQLLMPTGGIVDPGTGRRTFTGDSIGYSVKVTYNYTPGVAAVPEPSTWAMMLLGLGAIGLTARRRRRGAPLAAAA